jgi:competence protein ComEA
MTETRSRVRDDHAPLTRRRVRRLTIADRLRDWAGDSRAGAVAVAGLAIVAGLVWYRAGLGGGTSTTSAVAPISTAAASPTTETTRALSGDVTVHLAGAVMKPGVVVLTVGSRVIDALEKVGGGAANADLDRLNLAAKLTDGQRVFVPTVGEPLPVDAGSAGSAEPTEGAPVDLNAATQEQLEALPGIGPTLAEAILTERERRGGFRSVEDLRSVRGIGDARFADLHDLVTVG